MYPSIAIGYIVAELRRSGIEVDVLAPLSMGTGGVVREPKVPIWGAINQRARYSTAVSQSPIINRVRGHLARRQLPKLARDGSVLVDAFKDRLAQDSFDIVLVSTYLMYFDVCKELGQVCKEMNTPLVIGGSYFSQPEVAKEWMSIDGLSALVGGEVEPHIADIVKDAAANQSVDHYHGVWRNGEHGLTIDSPPLAELDKLAFPDYLDFPWKRYNNSIIPIITGRGCGWGRCTFCSDITSTAGRTYRSRSVQNVLDEIKFQSKRHGTNDFVFTDLKLNSNQAVWSGILNEIQDYAPGARWVASVHAGAKGNDYLSKDELKAARDAGMVRLTTGLESGSQRVLNLMRKGTELNETARVIRDAHAAGISVRVTMIIGYPGETHEDIKATEQYLKDLDGCIERISLNRFQIITGAPIHRSIEKTPAKYPSVTQVTVNHQMASVRHRDAANEQAQYRRSIYKLINAVHRVNRRPINHHGQVFEGVM